VLKTGEFKMIWENIGIDPHFVHALTYMLVAASRRKVLDQMLFMDGSPAPTQLIPAKAIQEARPELPMQRAGDQAQFETAVEPALTRMVKAGTCGACVNFQGEHQPCRERQFTVQAHLPVGECYANIESANH